MDRYFAGKTAIVTGAASGIGRALTAALAARGTFVVAADLNGDGAARVAADITGTGGRAESVVLDVSREDDVRALVDRVAAAHGRLDFMFNNAGIGVGGDERDVNTEQWRRVVEVDLWGVIHGTRAAYEVMVRQGGGHIVNTASLAGLVAAPMQGSYTTSKHAVVGLSRALRIEGADLGVRVSVICPGLIDTAIFRNTPVMHVNIDDMLAKAPIRRASPEGLADSVLRGIARNRAVIVYPLHARAVRWLDVLLPSMSQAIWRRYARDFRALRDRPKS
jgi:NAD(P)-dependent dehydrogenase (short-subunit alcohol dehydrogenase family)